MTLQEPARDPFLAVLRLRDTEEGLRGFEVADPDGHVLFFGRPREPAPA